MFNNEGILFDYIRVISLQGLDSSRYLYHELDDRYYEEQNHSIFKNNIDLNNLKRKKDKDKKGLFNEIFILASVNSQKNCLPFEIFYLIVSYLPNRSINESTKLLGAILIYYNIEQIYKVKLGILTYKEWQWEKSITEKIGQELKVEGVFRELSQNRKQITLFQPSNKSCLLEMPAKALANKINCRVRGMLECCFGLN